MDGRSHGNIRDQMKRRTLLTTLNAFPYVKTRIRVVDKEQSVLQPIEVAIEDIEKKNRFVLDFRTLDIIMFTNMYENLHGNRKLFNFLLWFCNFNTVKKNYKNWKEKTMINFLFKKSI